MKKSSGPTRGPNKTSIAILGPGAIGGLLAAVFWKAGFPVTCVARVDEVELLSKKGIHIRSKVFGNFTARPEIVSKLESKVDVLLVATKADSLSRALESVPGKYPKVVIPLLNGLEHIKILRDHFGTKIAVGMIGQIEAQKNKIDLIAHPSKLSPRIELASDKDIAPKHLRKISQIFSKAGIETRLLNSEAEVIWRKLVRLNAISCLTALTNKPLGFIRQNKKWKKMLEDCAREGVSVARAEGVSLNFAEIIKKINSLPAGLKTSLQRDIAGKFDSELEAIPGAVIRRARKHGLKCSAIDDIYQKLVKKTSKTRHKPTKLAL